ncbi:metallothionein-like protein 1 [Camellia sinensis]|uniref:metallothionein-like protein 1 n=1 Tax=Camellia sinensis TaxID=4442 RepID=UPI001035B023|nr:metallothionein-like protein 1 [Camellia sinensis]
MSGCGGNCNCGSDCKCDSSSKCGMYPDIENTTTTTIIASIAPPMNMYLWISCWYSGGSEKSFGAEGGHGCKCGSNCKCDPCTC